MCELTHGMAGERHGHGMLCVNPPLHVERDQTVLKVFAYQEVAPCSSVCMYIALHSTMPSEPQIFTISM